MSTLEMVGRDLTLRYVYANGSTRVQTHRVWDAERFYNARVEEGRGAKKPEDRFTVELVGGPSK